MRINRSLCLVSFSRTELNAAYAMNCDWQNLYARPTRTAEPSGSKECAKFPIVSVLILGLSYGAMNVLSYTRRMMQNY